MSFLSFIGNIIYSIIWVTFKPSLRHNLIFWKRHSLSLNSLSSILIISQVTRYPLEFTPSFQLSDRSELSLLLSWSSNIVFLIIGSSIEPTFRHYVIFRQLYFFSSLSLTSVEIIFDITSISFEGCIAQLYLAFGNKLLSWSCSTFFVIIISIGRLAIKFILWQYEVLLYHFVLSFRYVTIVLGVISSIWAIIIAFFNRIGALMSSYYKIRNLPQLQASHTHFPFIVCSIFCLSCNG